LKITAKHLLELKLVDDIIPEPLGGAHTDADTTAATLKDALLKHLDQLLQLPPGERLKQRYDKFRAYGHFIEKKPVLLEKAAEQPAPAPVAG
jgi:acetyl-CoA carboxylase carboxyl transferase subunit alpha